VRHYAERGELGSLRITLSSEGRDTARSNIGISEKGCGHIYAGQKTEGHACHRQIYKSIAGSEKREASQFILEASRLKRHAYSFQWTVISCQHFLTTDNRKLKTISYLCI